MLPNDVADILAQETLDALAELLNALDVNLHHAERMSLRFGFRNQRRNFGRHPVVPRHIGHQVFEQGKRPHWTDGDLAFTFGFIDACFAQQARLAVDLGTARTAFCRFAVPAAGESGILFLLYLKWIASKTTMPGTYGTE